MFRELISNSSETKYFRSWSIRHIWSKTVTLQNARDLSVFPGIGCVITLNEHQKSLSYQDMPNTTVLATDPCTVWTNLDGNLLWCPGGSRKNRHLPSALNVRRDSSDHNVFQFHFCQVLSDTPTNDFGQFDQKWEIFLQRSDYEIQSPVILLAWFEPRSFGINIGWRFLSVEV